MEQRCTNILQNYLKTQEYNTDYKIIDNGTNFLIKYGSITLFYVSSNNEYIKYNIFNKIIKVYDHNGYLYYFNNKNCIIYFNKNNKNKKIKKIYNNTEMKYYNKFYKIYEKIININKDLIFFKYYYKIKPFIIYLGIYIYIYI